MLFIFILINAQTNNNNQIEAKIDIESTGEFINVTGFAINNTDISASLHYVLSTIKNSDQGSNMSKNEQKGRFVLEPNQKMSLSKTTINSNDKDRVIILLLLYDLDDNVVGKDRVVLNDLEGNELQENDAGVKEAILAKNEISEDVTHAGADGVFLKGLVVEDTKTKPGRDFFKLYSLKYLDNKIEGEKIITIQESIAMGSNTRIQVKVENDIIFQFFVNPRADYIEQMVDAAIRRTSNYFQILRKNRSSVKKNY